MTLHTLRPNLLPEPRHTGSYHQPPLSPSCGGSRQGRAGMGLGSWRAMEVVRDRGLQLEGVVTPVMLPVPLTTILHPGVFRHQTSLQPRCRARHVPAPAQPTRWPATAGSASAQSWPATLSLHVPMAPMRSTVVRATGGKPSSPVARRQRGPGQSDLGTPWLARLGEMGAHAAPGKHSGPVELSLGFCRNDHLRDGGRGLA